MKTHVSEHEFRARVLARLIGLLVIQTGPMAALAADGDFDGSFGSGGIVNHVEVMPLTPMGEALHRVSSQVFPDGSVAISGTRPHRVSKFMHNGEPDLSYGVAGTTPQLEGQVGDSGTQFILAIDGRAFTIAAKTVDLETGVVLCQFGSNGMPLDFSAAGAPCVERLVPNGTSSLFWPQDLAVDDEGGVLVVSRDARIVRFAPDGSSDLSIGPGGIYPVEPVTADSTLHTIEAMKVSGDDVYLAGWILNSDAAQLDGIVHKLHIQSQGELGRDPVFGGGGPQTVSCAAAPDSPCNLTSIAVHGARVLVAGTVVSSQALHGTVATLSASTGETIGNAAVLKAYETPTTRLALNDIAVQSNGDVFVVGNVRDGQAESTELAYVARIRPECVDPYSPGFAVDGWTDFIWALDTYSTATSVVIGNGRTYVAGHTHTNQVPVESVAAFVSGSSIADGLFADGFESPCAP